MAALLEAFDDLKGALRAGENADAAIAEIAEEYALNPALLRRKFVESFGSIEGFAERADFADANERAQAAALKQREEEAAADARASAMISRRFAEARAKRRADDPFGEKALDRSLRRLARDFLKDDPAFADLLARFSSMGKRK